MDSVAEGSQKESLSSTGHFVMGRKRHNYPEKGKHTIPGKSDLQYKGEEAGSSLGYGKVVRECPDSPI